MLKNRTTVERTCQQCSNVFLALPSEIRRSSARFCNKQCYFAHQKVAARSREQNTARFFKYVIKTDSCWLWTGADNGHGYCSFRVFGKATYAHRAAYILFVGEIPEGLDVCHTCDVPRCVNPAHLFAATREENMHDMVNKGRGVRGEMQPRTKLTSAKALEIYTRYHNKEGSHTSLAVEYGVSHVTIERIVNGQRWAHATIGGMNKDGH